MKKLMLIAIIANVAMCVLMFVSKSYGLSVMNGCVAAFLSAQLASGD